MGRLEHLSRTREGCLTGTLGRKNVEEEEGSKLQDFGRWMMKNVQYLVLKILGESGEIEDLDEQFQEQKDKEEIKSVEER